MRLKTAGNLLVIIGSFLLLCTGGWISHNHNAAEQAALSARNAVTELAALIPQEELPAEVISPEYPDQPAPVVMPEQEIDGIVYVGILQIPDLGLDLPVISSWSSSHAKIAPCRYKGSVYLDDMIICAHNYKSHFGKLQALSIGDQICFTDMDGNQFHYKIKEFEILDGTAMEQMESGAWDLTLFTCTAGGKARYTVRCARIHL